MKLSVGYHGNEPDELWRIAREFELDGATVTRITDEVTGAMLNQVEFALAVFDEQRSAVASRGQRPRSRIS
jgi:hypothetical protein